MTPLKLNLALQGGGAHGAYTWGVLDRLLEEEDIQIDSISGTSAGAMNAVVLADGFAKGGREGAKERLAEFWSQISCLGAFFNPSDKAQIEEITGCWNIDNTVNYAWFDMITRMFSPYQLNPFNLNPLRELLKGFIDWETFNRGEHIHVHVTATSVRTGQAKVFHCEEIDERALLASACLPFFYQAVEIDGEPYWDGGYMGNPTIWPLIYHSKVCDVLLVQINPLIRDGIPKTSHEIINRLNEITSNSSLIAEMRAVNFVSKLIKDNHLNNEKYRDIHIHMIEAPDKSCGLNASSKLNTDMKFLNFLHRLGRDKMEAWLQANKQDIGVRSSVNLEEVFLNRKATPKLLCERRQEGEQGNAYAAASMSSTSSSGT